jgi:adenylate kinase family enzyme
MMRIVIYGNSGSGKSTMARALAARHGVALLELDTVVWESGKVAVLRPREDIEADFERFLDSNETWVVEGCYGELVEMALPRCSELVFLNPGLEACVANNRRRPWEPHKYESAEAQDAMLSNLIEWVAGYYTRSDQWSLAYHRHIYDSYNGTRSEVKSCVAQG